MESCNIQFNSLQQILYSFIKNGKIDSDISERKIDEIDVLLKKNQFEVLSGKLSDYYENTIFNALRNLRLIINEMRDQLKTAFKRGENPTTAERCLAMIPFIDNIVDGICDFQKKENPHSISRVLRDTRILRKKAWQNSLMSSFEKEIEGIKLPNEEIKELFDKFNENITSEIEEK
jgi:hypothetical protein